MTPRPSWFPADYDALLAGLARKAAGLEAGLTCWPMIVRPETALSPDDHLAWAVAFSAVIDELFEPFGMVTYKRKTGDQFFAALLIALEGMARRRPDAAELASDVAAGDLEPWAALAWLSEPPKRRAPEAAPTKSSEEMIANADPAHLEEMLKMIERAESELEVMPSFVVPNEVKTGASNAISVARERLVKARAADVESTLLAAYPSLPAVRSARLNLPVPPNAHRAKRLSTVAESVEVTFDVAPTASQPRSLYTYWSARDLWPIVEDQPDRMVFECGQQRVELTMMRHANSTRLRVRLRTTSPVEYR